MLFLFLQLREFTFESRQLFIQFCNRSISQFNILLGKPIYSQFPRILQIFKGFTYLLEFLCLFINGFQLSYLFLYLLNRGLRFHQGGEAFAQADVFAFRIPLLKHIIPDELVQVIEYFHPNNLVKERERFIRAKPEGIDYSVLIVFDGVVKFNLLLGDIGIVLFLKRFLPVSLASVEIRKIILDTQLLG